MDRTGIGFHGDVYGIHAWRRFAPADFQGTADDKATGECVIGRFGAGRIAAMLSCAPLETKANRYVRVIAVPDM